MNQSPIKVLQIIADFKKGGVQADVMYPARILSKDDVVFDVMLFTDKKEYYEDEFSHYGNIYRIPIKQRSNKISRVFAVFTNFFYVKKQMIEFLKAHSKYDAIHARHILYNAPCISAAESTGVPVRISHCHFNKPKGAYRDRLFTKPYHWFCSKVLNKKATHRFGVTSNAVEYMYGSKDNGIVVKNPTVDLDKFDPSLYPINTEKRIKLILVGSYSSRKNQRFAAEVLKELLKTRPDSRLSFIGYPRSEKEDYLPKLKEYVEESGMDNSVEFLPQDTNVAEALSKSTIMLIPSLQEGLPNVALEAQAMGVPCFVSTDVSEDCNCGICTFLPLNKGPKYWADEIIKYIDRNGYDKQYVDMSSWDNKKVCEKYLEYWCGKPMK
ncbi:MAG: glycosyltransferase [Ruminococcus sp.]|nr:glycosyltransferase [Ruminococcus sp.]